MAPSKECSSVSEMTMVRVGTVLEDRTEIKIERISKGQLHGVCSAFCRDELAFSAQVSDGFFESEIPNQIENKEKTL